MVDDSSKGRTPAQVKVVVKEAPKDKEPKRNKNSDDTNLVWSALIFVCIAFLHTYFLRDFLYTSFGFWGRLSSSLVMLFAGASLFFKFLETELNIERKGSQWLIIVFFIIWYIGFQSSIYGLIIIFLTVGLLPLLILLVDKFILKKSESGGIIISDWIVALPIIIFLLDAYVIQTLFSNYFPLTDFVNTFFRTMPWWPLLGIISLPSKGKGAIGLLAIIAKWVGIFAIIFAFIIPYINPDFGSETVLPGLEEAYQQQKEDIDKFDTKPMQELGWNLGCIFSVKSKDPQACVEEKKEAARLEHICTEEQGHKKGTTAYNKCIEDVKEAEKRQSTKVKGINDPTIKEPTNVKFSFGKKSFPSDVYLHSENVGKDFLKYPVTLEIENPRKENIAVEVSCKFTKKNYKLNEEQSFIGEMNEQQWRTSLESDSRTFSCSPGDEVLDGTYTLTYTTMFKGLKTSSRLDRAFIPSGLSPEEEESLIEKISKAHFKGSDHFSKAPSDFAQIFFAFGNPINYPIIKDDSGLLLSANIQNSGRGKITAINSYEILLSGFTVDNNDCLYGRNYFVPKEKYGRAAIYLPQCAITNIPSDLQSPLKYEFKEFIANLNYDYVLEETTEIKVQLVSGGVIQ
jgi:hypothetical protein